MYSTAIQHSSKTTVNVASNGGHKDMSVSKYVVAAICGCWWRESNCNPAIWESLVPCAWDYEYEYTHKGGYGLGQWTNVGTQHGRLYNLHTWVTNNGYSDGDGYGQIDFMMHENYWNTRKASRLGYTSLQQFLQSPSTSINDLVYDFLSQWEGVTGDHYSERCRYANTILQYLEQHIGESATWITGNRYLSEAQIKNNALVIYNYIGGSQPQGAYRIFCSSSGNGRCYAVPTSHDAQLGETFTIYAQPYGSDTLESLTARDSHGYAVAIEFAEQYTYDASRFPYDMWVTAAFSGEEPPPPPPPTPTESQRTKLPIWMYPRVRYRRK